MYGGSDHPDIANSMHNIAVTLQYLGKYRQALKMYKDAIDVYNRSLPPDHPNLTACRKAAISCKKVSLVRYVSVFCNDFSIFLIMRRWTHKMVHDLMQQVISESQTDGPEPLAVSERTCTYTTVSNIQPQTRQTYMHSNAHRLAQT